MERLTERLPSGVADYAVNMWELMPHEKSAYRQKCVEALAAYEERGYTPDEIDGLALEIATLKTIEAMYDKLGPVEDLAALVKARDEGRVVVLDMPRKPLVWGDNDHDTCLCPDCGEDLMGIPYGERMVLQCPACGQYLDATKIITRAEAEAALGDGENGCTDAH